ncbi:hypothetical protein H4R99_001142 [Coemansia sp. RSA 1722]|nr:hypothetical protein IWW45_003166 [Coemansia sp. RSA 485]KAJ2605413.1 hypothetical protein H4R99_001142 [Coemansia sp. RSA 1722]KAJ2640249.1 hypothetical protein GGF40_000148 [Coemansia sp. RSA 1286]
MDSQVRKRTRPCDTVEMPGSFPSRQKQRVRREMAALRTLETTTHNGLLSYVLFPVRMAKSWLFGNPAATIKGPLASISYEQQKQAFVSTKSSDSKSRRQKHNKGRRHRVPVATPLEMHHLESSKNRGRRPLVFGNTDRLDGLQRDRTNELVRHYTMPYDLLGTAGSYKRWRSISQSSSQTASEALFDLQSSSTDDPSQRLSFDSQSAVSIDDSVVSSEQAAPTQQQQQQQGVRSRRTPTGASESELWIAQLRKKIQHSLQVSVPAPSVSTPAYDRICKDDGELESRIEKERRKKQASVSLPADADILISSVFKPGFTRELNNTPVTTHDMSTLKPGTWLNDEVINFYMQLIINRAEKRGDLPRVHAFNTFFYSTLRDSGYARVRRWTRRIKLFEKDLVVVPVHLGVHWCCATVDFRSKTIAYYDALLGDNNECLQLLMEYLQQESKDKMGAEFDDDGWSMVCAKNIPRQKNGYDCGVFAITFAEHLARDAQLVFSQSNCPALRRKIIYEIASGALL